MSIERKQEYLRVAIETAIEQGVRSSTIHALIDAACELSFEIAAKSNLTEHRIKAWRDQVAANRKEAMARKGMSLNGGTNGHISTDI